MRYARDIILRTDLIIKDATKFIVDGKILIHFA